MGQAVDEKKRQIELTREAIAGHLDKAEARIRAELDWKARLRRDGPQLIAVVGGVAVVATAALLMRWRWNARKRGEQLAVERDDLSRVTLRDLAVELRELRAELEKARDGKDGTPLWGKLAVSVASAAASAGGRVAAKRMMEPPAAEQSASAHRSTA